MSTVDCTRGVERELINATQKYLLKLGVGTDSLASRGKSHGMHPSKHPSEVNECFP